jgi:hypothetical protein
VAAPDFVATPTLESSPHWDEQSLFDPHSAAGKSRMANHSSILWGQGGHPVTPPAHGTAGQSQIINAGPAYDNTVFPNVPPRSMPLSTPIELPPGYQGHFQSISPDYKHRVTTPGQNIGQVANPDIHSPNPQMQGHLPLSYGAPSAPTNFQSWNSLHGLPAAPSADAGSFPVYLTEHLPVDFNGQHMVPPDPNRSPGYRDL